MSVYASIFENRTRTIPEPSTQRKELRLNASRSCAFVVAGRSQARVETRTDQERFSEMRVVQYTGTGIQVRNILKLEIPTVTNLYVDILSAEWWGTEWGERVGKSGYTQPCDKLIMCTQSRTKSKSIVHVRSVSVV